MKLKSTLAIAALFGSFSLSSVQAAEYVIAGATAFRASAHAAIINLLGGQGVTEFAYDVAGSAGLNATSANRAIYKGTINGETVTVRVSWSNSGNGIASLDTQLPVQVLKNTVPVSTAGTAIPDASASNDFETNVPARFSFSDTTKLLSAYPSAPIYGEAVGVVPFVFVVGKSAPAEITNITDQQHELLWGSGGEQPASILTGDSAHADFWLFPTGRSASSGTRQTILSETQYGYQTAVVQFSGTYDGAIGTGSLTGSPTAFGEEGNLGYGSNSDVRNVLARNSNPGHLGGNYAFISYLTVSDAVTAQNNGAKILTYNGVPYSAANVANGSYTLWGYQQLYRHNTATTAEVTFFNQLKTNVDQVLTENLGLKLSEMKVERSAGEGSLVVPK